MGLAINDIVLVSFRGDIDNQRIIFTTTWRVSSMGPSNNTVNQDLDAINDQMDGAVAGSVGKLYLLLMGSNYTLREIRAQRIYPTRSAYRQLSQNVTGESGAEATVPNIAIALTLKTDEAGRRNIATKHLGPVPPEFAMNGQWGLTPRDAAGAIGGKISTILSVTGGPVLTPIIYHRTGDGPTAKRTDVTGYTVQSTVRTQRRRTVGLGE